MGSVRMTQPVRENRILHLGLEGGGLDDTMPLGWVQMDLALVRGKDAPIKTDIALKSY
jgi:hypothetical protein